MLEVFGRRGTCLGANLAPMTKTSTHALKNKTKLFFRSDSSLMRWEGRGGRSDDGSDSSAPPVKRPYEKFDDSVNFRSLPVVEFTDDVGEQLVWYDGRIKSGKVCRPKGSADVRQKLPVVMSPAYLGFAIEPNELRYLHYRDVGIVFARPRGGRFMQPSIDTILACYGVARLMEDPSCSFRHVIDVGSGSGFIGKFAAVHAAGEGELRVVLADIDATAMSYCKGLGFAAPKIGLNGRSVSWEFEAGDAVKLLEADSTFDLLISNPPYIPTIDECRTASVSKLASSFWEGCGLVTYLLNRVMEGKCAPGAHLVLLISSLTLKSLMVQRLLKQAPEQGVRVRTLVEREIGWKAWYAGAGGSDFLIASKSEAREKVRLGSCDFFVGATTPGHSRQGGSRDSIWDYHWHYVYVLDVCKGPPSEARGTSSDACVGQAVPSDDNSVDSVVPHRDTTARSKRPNSLTKFSSALQRDISGKRPGSQEEDESPRRSGSRANIVSRLMGL